jgi:hypothetical protein
MMKAITTRYKYTEQKEILREKIGKEDNFS